MQAEMNKVLLGLGINARCVHSESHRHLAFFDLSISSNTPIRRLETSLREIALGIRSKTVPILKVMPENGIVRLQVAMRAADPVSQFSLLANQKIDAVANVFPMLLGEDESGSRLWMDVAKCPHIIVAGGTGSGKSVLLHNLIANGLYLDAIRVQNVNIHLVDPKRVEFSFYKKSLFSDVIKSVEHTYDEVIARLQSLIAMMEERYAIMAGLNVRSIEDNHTMFPLCLMVIDEMADLMIQDTKGVMKELLITLAQKGRAAGIYLIIATQRPSVDILPGIIKANFPARIACKTASKVDSKVVLDEPGAEQLLGRGDAILRNMEHDRIRFQVAYTDEKEITENYSFQISKSYRRVG